MIWPRTPREDSSLTEMVSFFAIFWTISGTSKLFCLTTSLKREGSRGRLSTSSSQTWSNSWLLMTASKAPMIIATVTTKRSPKAVTQEYAPLHLSYHQIESGDSLPLGTGVHALLAGRAKQMPNSGGSQGFWFVEGSLWSKRCLEKVWMKAEIQTELQKGTPPGFISSSSIWRGLLTCYPSVDSTWWPATPLWQHPLSISTLMTRSGPATLNMSSTVSTRHFWGKHNCLFEAFLFCWLCSSQSMRSTDFFVSAADWSFILIWGDMLQFKLSKYMARLNSVAWSWLGGSTDCQKHPIPVPEGCCCLWLCKSAIWQPCTLLKCKQDAM